MPPLNSIAIRMILKINKSKNACEKFTKFIFIELTKENKVISFENHITFVSYEALELES
jgi:hypothetical protein